MMTMMLMMMTMMIVILMMMTMILLVDINGDGALILLSNLALIKVVNNPNVPDPQHTQSVRFLAEILTEKNNRLCVYVRFLAERTITLLTDALLKHTISQISGRNYKLHLT